MCDQNQVYQKLEKKHHRLYCRRTDEIGIQQGIDTAILSACVLKPFF